MRITRNQAGTTGPNSVRHALYWGSWSYGSVDNRSVCGRSMTGVEHRMSSSVEVTCRSCVNATGVWAEMGDRITHASWIDTAIESALDTLLRTEYPTYPHLALEPYSARFGTEDFTTDSRKRMREIVEDLVQDRGVLVAIARHGIDAESFGTDVVLSTNGHGAGFWDRGYGADGDYLHEMTRPHGGLHLYATTTGCVAIDG